MRKPKFKIGDVVYFKTGKIDYVVAAIALKGNTYTYVLLAPVRDGEKESRKRIADESRLIKF